MCDSYLTINIPSYFRGSSLALDKGELSKPTDNQTTVPASDTQLSHGSQPASLQQVSSAAGHGEGAPLLQADNDENVATTKDASHEERHLPPDTFRPQPVPSQQAYSAVGHEEERKLPQSENKETLAIREDASHQYSDTFRSSLEPNDRSCEGFLRENNYSNDRY